MTRCLSPATRHSRLIAILALTSAVGSGCEYWVETEVPDADDTPPLAAARILEIGGSGVDLITFGALSPASVVTSDPHREFIAIGAAWDPDGAQKVTMVPFVQRLCVNGDVGAFQTAHFLPLTAGQAGSPGDIVDTGVWTGDYVKTGDLDACPAGTSLQWAEYSWTVTAENFSGGDAFHGSAAILYEP